MGLHILTVIFISELAHGLDELSLIELFISIKVMVMQEIPKLSLEPLRLLYPFEGVLAVSQRGHDLIHGQELVPIDIQPQECGSQHRFVLLAHLRCERGLELLKRDARVVVCVDLAQDALHLVWTGRISQQFTNLVKAKLVL